MKIWLMYIIIIIISSAFFVPSVHHVSTLRVSAEAARASIAVCGASLQLCVRWVLAHNSGCVNRTIFFLFQKKFVKLTKLDIRELVFVKAAVLFAFKVNLRSPLKPPKSWPSENKNCVKTAQTQKKLKQQQKKSWCLEEKYCLVQGTSFIQIFILWPKMTTKMCGIQKKNFIE